MAFRPLPHSTPATTRPGSKIMALPTRSFGSQYPIKGSALGFGCMSLSPGFYGDDVDQNESQKALRKALDLGVTVLNTADFYTSMTSGETSQNIKLIGKVLKDYDREKIVLAMKWGPWIEGGRAPFDLSPAGCKQRVAQALEALGTDYIDVLVYRKMPVADINNTSVEDLAKGMKAVLDSGKVKAIGVSEISPEELKTIHSIVPVSLVELEWSLFSREHEADLIPLARSFGAGFLAYSPMGRGVLTGKYDSSLITDPNDFRNRNGRFTEDSLKQNMQLVKSLDDYAAKKGCTTAQLAIAWVLAQGDDVIPIPGTKSIGRVEENLGALNVKLSKAEAEELAELVPHSKVAGNRV